MQRPSPRLSACDTRFRRNVAAVPQSCQSGSGFSGRSSSGRAQTWVLKNCRASNGPDVGANSTFSVNDMVFTIAGIKHGD